MLRGLASSLSLVIFVLSFSRRSFGLGAASCDLTPLDSISDERGTAGTPAPDLDDVTLLQLEHLIVGRVEAPASGRGAELIEKSTSSGLVDIAYNPWLDWQVKGIASLSCVAGLFVAWSFVDVVRFIRLLRAPADDADDYATVVAKDKIPAENWSVLGIICLTSFRFYTGFLSATWLPYLLAMEGQYLWGSNQARFMGLAKLIYGLTILANPVLGLAGDRAASLSHGIGRRLFLRAGVAVAAMGVFVCIWAGHAQRFYPFIGGITLWRLGEAMNDCTTEALVPEMLPKSQFQLGSAIKAAMFLLGGLFGYVLLLFTAEVNFSWLYYAYLVGMFSSIIPSLFLLRDDAPSANARQRTSQTPYSTSLIQAYYAPAVIPGGFPLSCAAVFSYGLGTTPMFFLLLIIRDLVGVHGSNRLQYHFSCSSMLFFVSAALAAVSSADPGSQAERVGHAEQGEVQSPNSDAKVKRIWAVIYAVCISSVVTFTIPGVALLTGIAARLVAFYIIACIFGASFGSAFTKFQDVTWAVLPPGTNIANAMGFNVMSRLLGVGLGNFAAGMLLEFFNQSDSGGEIEQSVQHWRRWLVVHGHSGQTQFPEMAEMYSPMGYVLMCWSSGCFILMSAAFARWSLAVDQRTAGAPAG